MQNLKDTYKRAKENNKKAGASLSFSPALFELTKFLGVKILLIYHKKENQSSREVL